MIRSVDEMVMRSPRRENADRSELNQCAWSCESSSIADAEIIGLSSSSEIRLMRGKTYTRAPGWVFLALTLSVFMAGCGSQSPTLSEKRGDCYARKSALYAAAITKSYYDRGLLGTQLEAERGLDPGWTPSDIRYGAGFFDKRGKLIPLRDLSPEQQASFGVWEETPRLVAITDVDRKVDLRHDRFVAECANG